MNHKKKLIEVAVPLVEINDASAYDKMPGIGPHPKGIHHWWARLPLPVVRVVLFASVVDDPSVHPEKWPTEEAQQKERDRLFGIIRRMMQKQLHKHPEVYAEAQAEMVGHCDGQLPVIFDPFAGGGSIPLEANRLGFKAQGGDLNPIAVLLNKCNLELIPHLSNRPPVNPTDRKNLGGVDSWSGNTGIAADIRYYGSLIAKRVRAKIGHLYPAVKVTEEMAESRPDVKPYVGKELPVIAWIWTRTVASPNPAAHGSHVPLLTTFWLSSKKGREAWLEPIVDRSSAIWRFDVRTGRPKNPDEVKAGTKNGKGGFRCILSEDQTAIPFDYIRQEGGKGRLGSAMVAIVTEIPRRRMYLPVTEDQVKVVPAIPPSGIPDSDIPDDALGFRIQKYGIRKHWQMFTPRQLTAMVTLSDQVKSIREEVLRDAKNADFPDQEVESYIRTITTFLALALDRCADFNNALCGWSSGNQKVMHLFGWQILPMVWDFAEANILGDTVGSWSTCADYVADCVEVLASRATQPGYADQNDAAKDVHEFKNLLVSTDPPYYDNIGYAALSDFFYVWLRRSIGDLYPELFSTILVPKTPELTAAPERFGGDKHQAKSHFEAGFRNAFTALREKIDSRFPLTVYYAFKQDDQEDVAEREDLDEDGKAPIDRTTGWETLLEALIGSRFQITATWPVRASQAWRMRAMGANALATYIVLACRPLPADAPLATRREFLSVLKQELAGGLKPLQQGNIAPVDLAQAAIGPGMAVYSRYAKVVESDGTRMPVRTALQLINQALDEVLTEQEGEFDPETRWAIAWFEQRGHEDGRFDDAEGFARAKNVSVKGLVEARIVHSRGGWTRLLRREELETGWDPKTDRRLTIWEATQHTIRTLEQEGEEAAAALLKRLGGGLADTVRDLAYRLFKTCERKKWSQEALAYNGLVLAWPELTKLAQSESLAARNQSHLF